MTEWTLHKTYRYSEIERAFPEKDRHLHYAIMQNKRVEAFVLDGIYNPSIFKVDKNHEFRIMVAPGKKRIMAAEIVMLERPYPVFLKVDENLWKYIGSFQCTGIVDEPVEVQTLSAKDNVVEKVVAVLMMKRANANDSQEKLAA